MADMVFRCIQEMDIDNRMMVAIISLTAISLSDSLCCSINSTSSFFLLQLYQHIVLSGGSTMYPGLPSR